MIAIIVTAEELLKTPSIHCRYELVAGQLTKLSFRSWRRAETTGNLFGRLSKFVQENSVGKIFAAGTGFLIRRNPDTVLAPDLAFVAKRHIPEDGPDDAYFPGPPDLAVEVVSAADTPVAADVKSSEWLAAGCAVVWVIDLEMKNVAIYQSTKSVQVKTVGEMLVGDPVVPGFSCAIDELFR